MSRSTDNIFDDKKDPFLKKCTFINSFTEFGVGIYKVFMSLVYFAIAFSRLSWTLLDKIYKWNEKNMKKYDKNLNKRSVK